MLHPLLYLMHTFWFPSFIIIKSCFTMLSKIAGKVLNMISWVWRKGITWSTTSRPDHSEFEQPKYCGKCKTGIKWDEQLVRLSSIDRYTFNTDCFKELVTTKYSCLSWEIEANKKLVNTKNHKIHIKLWLITRTVLKWVKG